MCTVCGCSPGEVKIESGAHEHTHVHADGTVHTHSHDHQHEAQSDHAHSHDHPASEGHAHPHHHADGSEHAHPHVHSGEHQHDHSHDHEHHTHGIGGDLDYGTGPAGAHVPGLSQSRMVQIEQDILSKNNTYASANRLAFDERGIFALNLVSSPGSGKTTLLVKTIELLKGKLAISVVEGDQQTSNDAERIRATGVAALQINTGKGCHLDGHMVGQAFERMQP
ncbi:MAG: hydrogenase nickel incorporation protein HypB, partial [Azonexus sp.]|nr:hydrogenase nickel incorporation protein HypB [Azonexus sp.]